MSQLENPNSRREHHESSDSAHHHMNLLNLHYEGGSEPRAKETAGHKSEHLPDLQIVDHKGSQEKGHHSDHHDGGSNNHDHHVQKQHGKHHEHHEHGQQNKHRDHHEHAQHDKHHAKGHNNDKEHKGVADHAYDNAKKPDEATFENSVKTVVNEAKALGLSPEASRAALGSMLVESQGDPLAVGDHGSSFGLFQLHKGGELTEGMRRGQLKNANDAFDPKKNADVALGYFKKLEAKYSDPGALAAAAQRPKNRGGYQHKVDSELATVDSLIEKYRS